MIGDLERQAAAAAGYTVRRGLRSVFWYAQKGLEVVAEGRSEDAAWELAWKDLCRRRAVYRHKKGGIYAEVGEGRLTDRGDGRLPEVMIYEYLAPHEPGLWVRDLAEFNEPGRFERVLP